MVILPIKGEHAIIEVLCLDIPVAQIVDPVLFSRMSFIKEHRHRLNIIPIHLFDLTAGWKTHSEHSVSDVTDVEVVAAVVKAIALTGDQLSYWVLNHKIKLFNKSGKLFVFKD